MPAFPVAPITSDGSTQVQSPAAMQQVSSSGIPVATTEFVKPSPNTQEVTPERRDSGLDSTERAVVERSRRQQGDQAGFQNSQPDPAQYTIGLNPPDDMSVISVGSPPTYRFHRTADGGLYAISGRQSAELAPVPGDSYATIQKMRLVGAKAAASRSYASQSLSRLASFQGKMAATVAQQDHQRALSARGSRSRQVQTEIAEKAGAQSREFQTKPAENAKQALKTYAQLEAKQQQKVKRAEFTGKLKTAKPAKRAKPAKPAKPASVSQKVEVRVKLPQISHATSTSRKISAFTKMVIPTSATNAALRMASAA